MNARPWDRQPEPLEHDRILAQPELPWSNENTHTQEETS